MKPADSTRSIKRDLLKQTGYLFTEQENWAPTPLKTSKPTNQASKQPHQHHVSHASLAEQPF